MMNHKLYSSTLYLQDNTFYKGWSFFSTFTCSGEIVFNTGMTGYQEVITDPSYAGQILIFTYPELGNTGFNKDDNESSLVHVQGIVAKNISLYASNWRSVISLKDYLLKYRIPHIFGLDTRSLTKHLRRQGVMYGYIVSETLHKTTDFKVINPRRMYLVHKVSTPYNYKILNNFHNIVDEPFCYLNLLESIKSTSSSKRLCNIVVLDFGIKHNILKRLLIYGCNVYILSSNATYNQIRMYKPDGIVFSNGPGDPSLLLNVINNMKKMIYFSNIPMFGICMGHQLLSIALGYTTYKLKFGHRGLNHPSGLKKIAEITSQNHGFAVNNTSHNESRIKITYYNLNDCTVAGFLSKTQPFFAVQYHPESSPGPHDSDYLFCAFIKLVKIFKSNIMH